MIWHRFDCFQPEIEKQFPHPPDARDFHQVRHRSWRSADQSDDNQVLRTTGLSATLQTLHTDCLEIVQLLLIIWSFQTKILFYTLTQLSLQNTITGKVWLVRFILYLYIMTYSTNCLNYFCKLLKVLYSWNVCKRIWWKFAFCKGWMYVDCKYKKI